MKFELGIAAVGRIEPDRVLQDVRPRAAGKLLLVVCMALVKMIHEPHLVYH